MQKFISQKQLYSNVKSVSDAVQQGVTFIVLKYSKPAFKIVPLDDEIFSVEKKDTMQDRDKFILKSKNSESLYNTAFEDFQDMQFSGEKNLSQNIDNILYK